PIFFRATPLGAERTLAVVERAESLADPQAGSANVSAAASITAAVVPLLALLDFNDFAAVGHFGFRQPRGDFGRERATGRYAATPFGLRLTAQPGIDAVKQRVLPLPHRAQLPNRGGRLARLQRSEVEGLRARGRGAAGGGRAVQARVGLRQDPDGPVRLRQF